MKYFWLSVLIMAVALVCAIIYLRYYISPQLIETIEQRTETIEEPATDWSDYRGPGKG